VAFSSEALVVLDDATRNGAFACLRPFHTGLFASVCSLIKSERTCVMYLLLCIPRHATPTTAVEGNVAAAKCGVSLPA
jgi:hypothetical protein